MKSVIAMAAILVLAGCATPPSALQNAQHGMVMANELRNTLESYELAQQAVVAKRTQRLLGDLEAAEHSSRSALIEQSLADTGKERELAALQAVKTRVQLLEEDRASRNTSVAEREMLWNSLLQTARPPGDELGATGAAFSALATERSRVEQAREAFDFAQTLYKEVKAARKQPQTPSD